MEIIFILIPLSLVLVVAAVWALSWAAKSGQFDDLDSPALMILDDEADAAESTVEKQADSASTSVDEAK